MSTSDQNGPQLTRKQLRELRLTGSTPVISEEQQEPATAQEPAKADAPVESDASAPAAGAPEQDAPEEQGSEAEHEEPAASVPDAARAEHLRPVAGTRPLTRREMRELERARAAASGRTEASDDTTSADISGAAPETAEPDDDTAEKPASDPLSEARQAVKSIFEAAADEDPEHAPVVTGLPDFPSAPVLPAPVLPDTKADEHAPEPQKAAETERPKVGAAFGIGVKPRDDHKLPTAFDELLDTSSGSPKTASTLIFTPSPGVGSLSGPIASTGELLITGSYNLPDGIGSQGHAHGTTDGKDVDAVLIDGELAPASSPTPIAASSAVSTSKPAGEIIRPAAPDKGGKLTLTLAIVAGGLGLALVTVLIVAFFTNVL